MGSRLVRVMRALRGYAGRLALLVGSPLVFCGLAELGALALGVEPLADGEYHRRWAAIQRCRFDPAALPFTCSPARFTGGDRRAIFAYGGSSMVGFPIGDKRKITRAVRRRLERRYPGEYSVENLGSSCKGSSFVRRSTSTSSVPRKAARPS